MNSEDLKFDLTDYTFQLQSEEFCNTQVLLEQIKIDEDSRYHPLAQKSQPYDWCQALQYTN